MEAFRESWLEIKIPGCAHQIFCKRGIGKMSQEKVNRYKEEKANRKEILAKEKRQKRLMKI